MPSGTLQPVCGIGNEPRVDRIALAATVLQVRGVKGKCAADAERPEDANEDAHLNLTHTTRLESRDCRLRRGSSLRHVCLAPPNQKSRLANGPTKLFWEPGFAEPQGDV